MDERDSHRGLTEIDERLRALRAQADKQPAAGSGRGNPEQGIGLAFRIGAELVSALIVGLVIGYALDYWLGTKPWFLIVFFFLGAAAGVLNVYRATRSLGLAVGYTEPEKDAEDEEDDRSAGD